MSVVHSEETTVNTETPVDDGPELTTPSNNTVSVDPVANGMAYGVLLNGGLLLKRGGRWVTAMCCHCPSISTSIPGSWSSSRPRNCNDDCVMFREPNYNLDGTATIELCGGEVIKFNRLLDMRGHFDDINIATASTGEIISWLFKHNIIKEG